MRRSAPPMAFVFLGIGGGAEKQYRPSPDSCKPFTRGIDAIPNNHIRESPPRVELISPIGI